MKTKTLKLLAPLCLAAVVAGGYLGLRTFENPAAGAHDPRAPDRRDFALSDMNGQPVTLATYRGKWVLLFFGYTSCPDACPLALANLSNTLEAMGDAAKDMQPLFITVDPERDTPQVLKDYLANFDDRIIGLTGTPRQIAAVAGRYQTFYRKHPTEDGNYLMEHSTAFELISPDGIYLRAFRPDDDPEDFAEKELLSATHGIGG